MPSTNVRVRFAAAEPGFGRAGPYDRSLRSGGGRLQLHGSATPGRALDIDRFLGPADAVDRALLTRLDGPLLDIGCGPGRMLGAAASLGLTAVGTDVSSAAVDVARRSGHLVLHRSVFDHLPLTGRWGSILLLDGNVGIGGDPAALLRRCGELLAPAGTLVVEVEPDDIALHRFSAALVDQSGRRGSPFRWAEIGAHELCRLADQAGLSSSGSWSVAGRTFVALGS